MGNERRMIMGRHIRKGEVLRFAIRTAIVPVFLIAAVLAWAQVSNLVTNGGAETGDKANWVGVTSVISEGAHSGSYCLLSEGGSVVYTSQFIPVDTAKTYMLKGWFKSTGNAPSKLYFGYMPCDANKKQIMPAHVLVYPGTETTLTENCKKEDMLLKIADGSKWQAAPYAMAAFGVDDSGNYADLPNRNLASTGILKVEKREGYWEVQLAKPCNISYPANTKVREHRAAGTYIYNAAGPKLVPAEWTEYQGTITGESLNTAPPTMWWKGTKFAKILILSNEGQDKEFKLLIDDISMEELVK